MTNHPPDYLNDAFVAVSSTIFRSWPDTSSALSHSLALLVYQVCTVVQHWLHGYFPTDQHFLACVDILCSQAGYAITYENIYACVHFGWASSTVADVQLQVSALFCSLYPSD